MDLTNLDNNDTFLTGEHRIFSCAVDHTLASTPAPIAMSTVGRDRGIRRHYMHESSLFSTSPPPPGCGQSNAEDSLGLLPPECLMGMSNSLLPLETINNGSRQGVALVDSCSSKEFSSESHETLATVKKRPLETSTRAVVRRKPQVLFPQVEEEDAVKADSFKRSETKDFCCEPEAHRSSDSGVGQTIGSYGGQTISSRSNHMSGTSSSGMLDSLKVATDRQTFFYSLSGNSANTRTVTEEKSGRKGESGREEDLEIFQSFTRCSGDNRTGTLPNGDEKSSDALFDNFAYKVNIKADLQNVFTDLGLRLSDEGKDLLKNGSMEASKELHKLKNTQATGKESSSPKQANNVALKDGPFKLPLLPRAVERVKKAHMNTMNQTKSDQAPAESIVSEWGPSINFGESFISQKADSTTEWGPSIQFGDSVQQQETPRSFKESPPLEDDLAGTQSDSLHQGLGHIQESVFGNQNESSTPFDGFGQEMLNASEEFIEDAEAKAKLLEVDKEQFVKENPFSDLTLDVTKSSYREPDDTFMNLTIGTYLAAGSNEFDGLTCKKYNRERPDIGMPVYSPPQYRRVVPVIQPSEIYSPINIRSIRSKPVTSSDSRVERKEDTFEVEECRDQDPSPPSFENKSLPTEVGAESRPPLRIGSDSMEIAALVQDKEMSVGGTSRSDTTSLSRSESQGKSVASQQLAASQHQPVASQHQPVASQHQPVASQHQPVASQHQPEPQIKNKDTSVVSQNYNLQDGTINLTSDMTFGALHRLIEGLDSNMSHPEHLILLEVNRHLEEKKKEQKMARSTKAATGDPEKQVAEIVKDPSETKEDFVFKQPLPFKSWAPKSGKISKAASFKVAESSRLAEHTAREMSSNMHFEDVSSLGLTMSLEERSLTPNAGRVSAAGMCYDSNTNNSYKAITQSGEPEPLRFQPQQSLVLPSSSSEAYRGVPQGAESSKKSSTLQIVPYSENSTFIDVTQPVSTSGFDHHRNQGYPQPRDRSATVMYGQNMLNDSSNVSCDTSSYQCHTLCPADSSHSIWIPKERGFASSTPMPGTVPYNAGELQEKSILPMITPQILANLLTLPKAVSFPEATCVMLSQETSFQVTNNCDKGVKVSVNIREVTLRGQRMSQYCPFYVKSQIILSDNSSQDVQVMFQPKEEGEHTAVVELFSVNMIRAQETRLYTLIVSAYAEKPQVKIWPDDNTLNFGTLPWGGMMLRSIKIQNNGRATVPLILNISRKEASMCTFTFLAKDTAGSKSLISFTCPPGAKGSVLAMSLPGVREGEDPPTHTLELCCKAKGVSNIEHKIQEKCENFQAVLDIGLDMPAKGLHLKEIKLLVAVGMYKLHVDRDSLIISALPGKSETECINIINSGNIPMPVELELPPLPGPFRLSTSSIEVPSGDKIPVSITFSPPQHPQEKQEKYNVSLSLSTAMFCYSVRITGKVSGNQVKIASALTEINFGGVDLGLTKKQSYTFMPHGDTMITLSFRDAGECAFKLLNERGQEVKSLEMPVRQGKQYEIWISFCPTGLSGFSAELILRTEGCKFSVPVRGYGGRSRVEIKDLISDSNEWLLNVGRAASGQPVCHKMKINNTGPRCCFIKGVIKDLNGDVFAPVQASIVPPMLSLAPHKSAEIMVMIFPSQREIFSSSNQLATIKLIFGDEVNRQHFLLKPGKRGKEHLKKFDIPLSMDSTMKEIINNEMKTLPCHENTFSVLKNSLFKIHIKVICQPAAGRIPSQQRYEADYSDKLMASTRPALTPLSPNIRHSGREKDEWMVAPKEIWINGDQPSSLTQCVQVINFSAQELRFYTECGENITVFPTKGTVKSKDTTMLHLSVLNRNFSANWFGLFHVLLSPHDRQVIKVFLTNPSEAVMRHNVTAFPTTDHKQVAPPMPRSPERPAVVSRPPSLSQQHPLLSPARNFNGKVQGSDKAILMTTDAGTKSYMAYYFKNTSQEPVTWKLSPFVSPYVKDADDTHSLYRVDYEVFKLIPLTGVLQPGDAEEVTIEFCPRSRGYFNQDWSILDLANSQVSLHNFTILAKSTTNPGRESQSANVDSIPEGLSKTSVPSESRSSSQAAFTASKPGHSQARGQTPVARKPTPAEDAAEPERLERFSPMPSTNPSQRLSNESQSDRNGRPVQGKDNLLAIVEPNVQFPKVPIGGTMNLKISIKNATDEKVEIVVDYEPKPPFMIKQYNFQINKDRMMLFPVIFKPKHKGHFTDKLVFKETASGVILTAYLEAEC